MHLKVQRAVGVDYKFYVTYYTVWGMYSIYRYI
jgi:hypothetical protein